MFGTNEIVGQKYFKDAPARSLFVTSMFFTLQGEGPFNGKPALFIRLAKCNLACSFCFVPSTKITMADGKKKKIKDIVVGDSVMSWSGDKFEPKQVTKTYTSTAETIIKVTSTGEPVWCTPEHPFLTSNRGWINAEDLLPGDKLVHWGNSAHKTLFNPMFTEENRVAMSQEEKDNASVRLQNKWDIKEFRDANIKRMTGDTKPMKDPAIALKSFVNRENQSKSGLEEKIEKICAGLPITFVGSGDLIISYKVPDFVVDGQKKVIEVWADDAPFLKDKPRDQDWMDKRKALFAKEGYDTLFLPLVQSELKISEHYKIREKVAQFINNGKIVKKIEVVSKSDGHGMARLFGTKDAARIVYNLEVEDNHTYIANGCVVHNCDTFFDDGDWMTYEQISSKAQETVMKYWTDQQLVIPDWVLKQRPSDMVHGITDIAGMNVVLVVTGGEPLLQKNLMDYLNYAKDQFAAMQIESNGTVNQEVPAHVTLVCSPKCTEKNNVAVKYLAPTKLILERADCLKFVMSAEQDSPYSEVPDWAHEWKAKNPGKEIFVSPMNIYNTFPQKIKLLRAEKGQITMEERSTVDEVIDFWEPGLLDMKKVEENHKYVARYCMQHGFRLNLQMHLYAGLS